MHAEYSGSAVPAPAPSANPRFFGQEGRICSRVAVPSTGAITSAENESTCCGAIRGRVAAALAALLLVVATGVLAQDLKQAVETAIKTNPQVTSTAALARAAREDVTVARSGFLPSIDLAGGLGREHSDIPQTRALGLGGLTLDRQEAGVTITQRLFDGHATRSEVSRQTARLASANSRLTESRESIALRATEAYVEVLKNRELLRLAEENLQAHVQTRDRVQLRVKAGVSQSADLLQADGRVALARSIVSARAGALRAVEATYARVVGQPPAQLTDPSIPAGAFVRSRSVDGEAVARAIRQMADEAAAAHPTLAVANAELAAAEAATQGAKAPFMPRINLELGANRNRNIGGVSGDVHSEIAMLTMRWNVFRGGADSAQERALAERRFAAVDSVANAKREIDERVALAVQRKATSEERLAHLADHVKSSAEVLRSYQQQFELGRRSLLDLLNAETELFNARSTHTVGRHDDVFNHFFLESAKGALVKSLGIALSD